MQQSIEAMQRRQLELQERELNLRGHSQEMEYQLRQRAQADEVELRRLAIARADENEKAAQARLGRTEQARTDFAKRGQTFAMRLATALAIPLLIGGMVCIFLAVAGVGSTAVDLTAGSILLASSLFAGVANLVGRFLPRD